MLASRYVYVVGGDNCVSKMFACHGWEVIDSIKNADLVQFTGGSDVTPSLYRHTVHPTTYNNAIRDRKEMLIFNLCIAYNKPMAGICRGAQFLNVMCGGKLFQDVDNHASGNFRHECRDIKTNEVFEVTSTHHQMMIPTMDAVQIGVASESTRRCLHVEDKEIVQTGAFIDKEILYYPQEKCFCFQPHPEFSIGQDLARRYFKYLDEYLFEKKA